MNLIATLAGWLALGVAIATPAATSEPDPGAIATRDAALVEQAISALPRQRPGIIDLYAVGVAGDGTENVFRNEVEYFVRMSRQRLNARGTVALVSHPASLQRRPLPLATYDNLRIALDGIGKVLDPDEDVLLLYLTMHGTPGHELVLYFPPLVEDVLVPEDLQALLAESGIRHRVVVLSACYSGGFVPGLRADGTMVITAASADQPSFGCGNMSNVTWFGRAWMVEGLSQSADFRQAFRHASERIARWEAEAGFDPSDPQLDAGAAIGARLQAWREQTPPGPPLDYPLPLEAPIASPEASSEPGDQGSASTRR